MNTIADLLGDASAPVADTAGRALSESAATDLGPGVQALSARELGAAVGALLEEPVANLAVRGWQRSGPVRAAIERTRAAPGTTEVVELLRHELRSAHRPRLEVLVGDTPVKVIELDLEVGLSVDSVVLRVRDGRISGWAPGGVEGRGVLSLEGVPLLRREQRIVDLGTGPADVDDDAHPAGAGSGGESGPGGGLPG